MLHTSDMKAFIIAAVSADGFIAPTRALPLTKGELEGVNMNSGSNLSSTTWTSPGDTQFFKDRTKAAGVVIYGRKTYETIPEKYRPLQDRLNVVYTSTADAITNSLPLTKGELEGVNPEDSQIYTTNLPPHELLSLLKPHTQEVAICGGTSIYTQFLKANLVDTIYLTVEPILFGTGTPLFDKQIEAKLQLESAKNLNPNTLLLTYKVI
jgi:dihydrofolate reductase